MTPDDGAGAVLAAAAAAAPPEARTDVIAFVADADSEAALRQGLAGIAADGLAVHRGGSRAAAAMMARTAAPRVLVVDVSGEEQPLSALAALSDVVEPNVRVLVVGDRQDVNLYRALTRGLGVAEYLYKPLSAEVVAQHFGPVVRPQGASAAAPSGGRVLTVTGVRGGAGATTLAANLAWHLATEARRHTVLVDADLQAGTAALLLGAKTGGGLRTALESPARVDDLFIERIAQPAAERLSVIAGEESLTDRVAAADGATGRLLEGLRRRYNYVVADVPLRPTTFCAEMLDHARQRVLVLEATLPCVRDALRILALPAGPQQTRRSLTVVNKLGAPGTMSRKDLEKALGERIDVAVPYLPHLVNTAAATGVPAAASRGAFRAAVRELGREAAALRTGRPAPPGLAGRLFGRGRDR